MVEISGEPRHLGLRRGSIVVSTGDEELGYIDLDNVLSVIVTSRGATFTSAFVAETAARNIPIIICDSKFKPVSVTIPVVNHGDQTRRFQSQAQAKLGFKNKVWKHLVVGKVRNQARLLGLYNAIGEERLMRLASQVSPGDPKNIEAQAAQVYWADLFGKDFRRDRNLAGINSLLNYGYAIIRSSMTSAVLSAGLHPTFGIFHKNKNNALCLVDDLMEPYRPLVDQLIKRLSERGHSDLNSEVKRCLASIVTSDQHSVGKTSPLLKHMCDLSFALYESFGGQASHMIMPELLSQLEVEAMVSRC